MSSIEGDVSPGLVAGRLEGVTLLDLVWQLCRRKKTGLLEIQREHVRRTLFVQDGRIVFAASSDPNDRLGEMLLRQAKITLDQLEEGLVRLRSGKRLGTLLVEAGALTTEQLVDAVLGQVKSVVLDVLASTEGEYLFREEDLPTQEVITLQIKTAEILLQGVRSIDSFSRLRARVGGPRRVYALSPGWRDTLDGLALSEGEKLVLGKLEAGDCTVDQLCGDLILSNFEIYQVLFGLRLLGVTTPGRRLAAHADAGTLEPGALAELLVRLGRDRATGVLFMTRGGVERTLHLRDGRCVFATSNNPDDGLVSFLFRRGVISLHDREETGRRLLSNKRVGTILLELGVIDDADLQEMVRQQLSEIVCDTFTWHRGEFIFVAGNLPSVEAITLDQDVSTIVAEGLRRVKSWTRLLGGCGGIDNPLALTPTYLDQLDAMEAGVEEWEVVNALKTPQTPRRVCRVSSLGDFRICQILWTLKLLGAVVDSEELEIDESDDAEVVAPLSAPVSDDAGARERAQVSAPVSDDASASVSAQANAPVSDDVSDDVSDPIREDDVAPVAAERVEPLPRQAALERTADVETPPAPEPSVDATRRIARDEVEAALRSLPTAVHGHPEDVEEPQTEPASADAGKEKESDSPGEPDAASTAEPLEPAPAPMRTVRAAARRWWAKRKTGKPIEGAGSAADVEPDVVASADAADPVTPSGGAEPVPDVTSAPAEVVAPAKTAAEPALVDAPAPEIEHPAGDAAVPVAEPFVSPVDEPAAADSVEIVFDTEEVGGAAAPSAEEASEDVAGGWDLPDRVDAVISRFNAMHRVVYRAVRLEIGAGAVNFVRSCCEHVAGESDDLIAGVELLADGSWDVDGLKSVLASKRVEDPWPMYQQLLDQEFVSLQPHLDDNRAVELKQRIWELQQSVGS